MTDQKMREAFEAFARVRGANDLSLERDDISYKCVFVKLTWEAWQAALAIAQQSSVPVAFKLPEPLPPHAHYETEQERQNDAAYRAGWNTCRNTMESMLTATPPAAPVVPVDVMRALERMEKPLDPSWLSGVTAQGDARCMKVIGNFLRSLPTAPACQTCNDHGMIGGFQSTGSGEGGYDSEPCPDCTPAPDCGRCNGSGESTGMAGAGPDTYEVDIPCPDCKGTGDAPEQREKVELTASVLKIGGKYNWKGQPERLVYLGRERGWHQFAKVDEPRNIWSEVLGEDLHMLEETQEAAHSANQSGGEG